MSYGQRWSHIHTDLNCLCSYFNFTDTYVVLGLKFICHKRPLSVCNANWCIVFKQRKWYKISCSQSLYKYLNAYVYFNNERVCVFVNYMCILFATFFVSFFTPFRLYLFYSSCYVPPHHRTPMPFTTLTLRYEWSVNVMDTTWVSDDGAP